MNRKHQTIIILLAALKFVLPFLLHHPSFELHRDEYLYYEQGQHLSLGYLENPPLIGVLAYISSILGGSFFVIKFWPAFFGALTLLLTVGIVKELGGKLFAQIVASLGILFTAYLRVHFLFQPNFLDIFFWTLSAYFLIRFINTADNKFLYLLSASLALGWWSKSSVLFFAIGIVVSLLLSQYRMIIFKKHFWLAVLLGAIIILPNVYWQYMHRWPLIHHMQELRETQLKYIDKSDFIKDQLLLLLPVAFVWLGGLVWLLKNRHFRIVVFVYLCVIFLLMLGSGKGYYALGAYPMLLAAGGVWLERITFSKPFYRYTTVVVILLLSLPLVPILMPMHPQLQMAENNKRYKLKNLGILKWEDQEDHALQQDFADMTGWKEMATKTESYFKMLPNAQRVSTVVYCRNYGQAGALKYYAQNNFYKSKIICDNGTFVLWIPDEIYFKNLLFVGEEMPGKDDEVFQHFQKMTVIDSVANPLSREYGTKIIYFENADNEAYKIATAGLQQMKSVFIR